MDHMELDLLIKRAIDGESEAYKFYKEAAEKAVGPAVKQIFLDLAKEEKGHEESLWKLKGDATQLFKVDPGKDYKVSESTDLPELSFELSPAEAIQLAMKKEQQAMEMYQTLADMATEGDVKSLLTNLANMERSHKIRLEEIFVQVGYPEVW